jgi:hypothetical protein
MDRKRTQINSVMKTRDILIHSYMLAVDTAEDNYLGVK